MDKGEFFSTHSPLDAYEHYKDPSLLFAIYLSRYVAKAWLSGGEDARDLLEFWDDTIDRLGGFTTPAALVEQAEEADIRRAEEEARRLQAHWAQKAEELARGETKETDIYRLAEKAPWRPGYWPQEGRRRDY